MASMIDILMILDDIDKSRIIPLKSGKKGYRVTMYVDDKVDKYGNNVSAWAKQDKEEQDSEPKVHRKYFANGTCFWSDGKTTIVTKDNPEGKVVSPQPQAVLDEPKGFTEENDNLPF